jgi:hypothetical protein
LLGSNQRNRFKSKQVEEAKMAAVPAFAELAALFTRMGVSNAAALYFCQTEGLDTVEEVQNLTDDDIVRLCQVTRKPGGMMANPGAAVSAVIPHAGTLASMRAEKYMKLCVM